MAVNEHLVARVGADLTGFNQGMGKMGRVAQRVSGNLVKWAKRSAIAIAGIGVAAAVVGAKFENELMKTATVARAFGKDLDALKKKARDLGSTTAFTATQAVEGMYALASAGMNTKEIIDATEHAMKLAGATGTEMAQSTQLLAASLKQFGLEASQSKRVVDTFAGAITTSLFTMEKLTRAMRVAGPVGNVLRWSIEETVTALSMFINQGLTGADAGQKLKTSMQFLIKNSNLTQKALAELNLTFKDVNPQTHNFGEILKTVGERGMTVKQSLVIFGRFAGPLMTSLAEKAKQGKIDFDGFYKSLVKSQEGVGRTTEMYNRMMDTFLGRWKIFLSALQDMGIEIFYTFDKAGRKVFDFLTETVNLIKEWGRTSGIFDEVRAALESIEVPLKKIRDHTAAWLMGNRELIKQKAVTFLGSVKMILQGIWDIISYAPEILTYGLIGLAVWGRAGFAVVAGLALFKTYLQDVLGFMSTTKQVHLDSITAAKEEIASLEKLKARWLSYGESVPKKAYKASAAIMEINERIKEQNRIIELNLKSISNLNRELQKSPPSAAKPSAAKPPGYPTGAGMLDVMAGPTAGIGRKETLQKVLGNYKSMLSDLYGMMETHQTITVESELSLFQNRIENYKRFLDQKGAWAESYAQAEQQIEDKLYALAHSNVENRIKDADREYLHYLSMGGLEVKAAQLFAERMKAIQKNQMQSLGDIRDYYSNDSIEKMKQQHKKEIEQIEKHFEEQMEIRRKFGDDTTDLSELQSIKEGVITEKTKRQKVETWRSEADIYTQMAGRMSSIMEMMYSSGMAQSQAFFEFMKAIRYAETIINTAAAMMKAYIDLPVWAAVPMMAIIAAQGAIQLAVIARQKPLPRYEQGGIVRGSQDGQGTLIRAGERGDEAIIPLKGGGVPVSMSGGSARPIVIQNHYHMERSSFMDQRTLRRTMATVAVGSMVNNYRNDGVMRTMIKRGV